jgi:hypothetical protein
MATDGSQNDGKNVTQVSAGSTSTRRRNAGSWGVREPQAGDNVVDKVMVRMAQGVEMCGFANSAFLHTKFDSILCSHLADGALGTSAHLLTGDFEVLPTMP